MPPATHTPKKSLGPAAYLTACQPSPLGHLPEVGLFQFAPRPALPIRRFYKLALLTAIRYDITTLILGGDLLATDQPSLNSWTPVFKGEDMDYESVVGMANQLLAQFGQHFDDIHCISGNHDERLGKKTGGELWIRMLLDNTKTTYYKYRYMFIETSRGSVKVLHPENFSSTPVALGRDLHDVEPRKSHIVLGHTHIQQSGFSKDGEYEIHALGCMRNPQKTQYKQLGANKHFQWQQGFLMVREGYFYPLTRKGTNWKMLLGEDLYRESGLGIRRIKSGEHCR